MSKFSERIKIIRNERNLTQKEMATIFNISERAYQYYEAGDREPNVETLIYIANALDVSVDYLLGQTLNQKSHKI